MKRTIQNLLDLDTEEQFGLCVLVILQALVIAASYFTAPLLVPILIGGLFAFTDFVILEVINE